MQFFRYLRIHNICKYLLIPLNLNNLHNILEYTENETLKVSILQLTSQASDNLFLKTRERNLLGQNSVRKLQYTTLRLLLLFYFSKRLSLAALFWNWKNILKQNHGCFTCSLLQTCFSVLCWCVPLCKCYMARVGICNVSRSTMNATGCEILFYVVLYSCRIWYISRKNKLVMNWYNILGHDCSFLMPL